MELAGEAGSIERITRPLSARSVGKRRSVLDAAQLVFLRVGYDGATMDEVASVAKVSKPTIYKHFADKRELFSAVIDHAIDAAEATTTDLVAALGTSVDLDTDFQRFARQHVVDVLQPHLVQLRRLVIGVANRFPDLASEWYRNGPARGHAAIAEQLSKLADRALLRVGDPLLAAQQLNWLILSIPLNAAMFDGRFTGVDREYVEGLADEAARIFLAAYRSA